MPRFPSDFMFQLNKKEEEVLGAQYVTAESNNLKSQFVTSSYGGRWKPIFAFTEQGIAMLSSVLKSDRAIAVNIKIMRTFTELRRILSTHKKLRYRIEKLEKKYDGQSEILFKTIRQILT